MSSPAPVKPTTTTAPAAAPAGGYEVARPQGKCLLCNAAIEPDIKFMAALQETAAGFARVDYCAACWPSFDRKDVVAFWQTTMPRPETRKKIFVDDTILCELFERLASVEEPAKVNFRFVLGLILMRKRLLIYESTRNENARELWSMRFKGREDLLDLYNPRLDEAQIREVSQQLGEILHQEL